MRIEDGKRVYLVLHGINGNSNEGYVVDFVHQQVSQGNVVAVMVSRGFGDSRVLGDDILHFSRISDVGAAAKALRTAINRVSAHDESRLLLAGVGKHKLSSCFQVCFRLSLTNDTLLHFFRVLNGWNHLGKLCVSK